MVLAARRAERLEALADVLDGSLVVPVDLAEVEARERLIATMVDELGRLDVLVNNAGIGGKAGIEDETVEDFRDVMEVNVTGSFTSASSLATR